MVFELHETRAWLARNKSSNPFWSRRTSGKRTLDESFNERQRKVINRMVDGFEGKLTSSKWAKLTKCSQDTALRDISDLVARKILMKDEAGGRSTSYTLALP